MITAKRVVRISFDTTATIGTCMGAYRATILWEGVKGEGKTQEEALNELLKVAGRLGYPAEETDYNIITR